MLYIEYENYKNKLYNAQQDLDKILCEKEELFARTQPQGTKYDKVAVNGGSPSNSFDEYLIAKEKKQIEERLAEAKSIVNDRKELLLGKEEELKQSKNIYDKVYYFRCIENKTPTQISYSLYCDRATVYRYMDTIAEYMKENGYELYSLYARKQKKW